MPTSRVGLFLNHKTTNEIEKVNYSLKLTYVNKLAYLKQFLLREFSVQEEDEGTSSGRDVTFKPKNEYAINDVISFMNNNHPIEARIIDIRNHVIRAADKEKS